MGRADTAASVSQRVFRAVDYNLGAFLKIGVQRGVHTAEEGGRDRRPRKLSILNAVHPSGHPAAANKGFVGLSLIVACPLNGGFVQPDVGDVEPLEDTVASRFPGETEQHGFPLISIRFFGRRKFPRLGTEGCGYAGSWFFVLGAWCLVLGSSLAASA